MKDPPGFAGEWHFSRHASCTPPSRFVRNYSKIRFIFFFSKLDGGKMVQPPAMFSLNRKEATAGQCGGRCCAAVRVMRLPRPLHHDCQTPRQEVASAGVHLAGRRPRTPGVKRAAREKGREEHSAPPSVTKLHAPNTDAVCIPKSTALFTHCCRSLSTCRLINEEERGDKLRKTGGCHLLSFHRTVLQNKK